MACCRSREEIVGKRFLSVVGPNGGGGGGGSSSPATAAGPKLKLTRIAEWEWRAGVVRAASHKDPKHRELTVLVEFDDVEWKRREWIRVYEENAFLVFIVEHTLNWALRKDPNSSKNATILWPALSFKVLVDKVSLSSSRIKPIEFLVDRAHSFLDSSEVKSFQEGEDAASQANNYAEVKKAIKQWTEFQDGQQILLTTPSVLVGERLEVYRVEGTTQWYTAVIGSYNENTRELALTDDTVLEEHNEDPCLVQMCLIGDGVVESILRGENTGITPRRRTCTLNNQHLGHYTRTRSQSQSPSNHNPRFLSQAKQKTRASVSARPNEVVTSNAALTAAIAEADKEKVEKTSCSRERKRKSSASEPNSSCGDIPKVVEKVNGKKSKAEELQQEKSQLAPDIEPDKLLKKGCPKLVEKLSSSNFSRANSPGSKSKSIEGSTVKDVLENSSDFVRKSSVSNNQCDSEICKKNVANLETNVESLTEPRSFEKSKSSVISAKEKKSAEESVLVHVRSKTDASDNSDALNLKPSDLRDVKCYSDDIVCAISLTRLDQVDIDKNIKVSEHPLLSISSAIEDLERRPDKGNGTPDSRSDSGISDKSPAIRSESSRSSDERCASRSSECSRLSDERSGSRLSTCDEAALFPQLKAQNRVEEQQCNKVSSKGSSISSPLVFDKSEPVRVWRDPKLVNSDTTVRHVHSIQHSLMAHPSSNVSPSSSSSVYSTSIPVTSSLGATGSHPPVLSQHGRSAVNMGHYPAHLSSHVIPAHAGNPHMEPHALHIPGAAPGSVPSQQNLPHLLPQHAAHLLPQYASHMPVEMLWQQKYGSIPVAASWMPLSYQEDMVERKMERDRRELVERDRLEREKEKEREKQEKERHQREILEHEHMKRLKMEQDSADHEHERANRERLERERAQRDVHQHFETSLRLASKKRSNIGWSPTPISSLNPKGGNFPIDTHSPGLTAKSLSQVGKLSSAERREAEQTMALEMESKEGIRQHGSRAAISPEEEKHAQDTEKWILAQQHHTAQKFSQAQHQPYNYSMSEAINRSSSSRSKTECPASSSSHTFNYNSKPGTTPSQTSSPAHIPKIEPSFNLYGYQPFQHSYINQEKLAEQGKTVVTASPINCSGDMITSTRPPSLGHAQAAGSLLRHHGLPSPPPLLPRQEPERKSLSAGGVIVSQDLKSVSPHSLSPKQQQQQHPLKSLSPHLVAHKQQLKLHAENRGSLYAPPNSSGGTVASGAFKPYEMNCSPSPSVSPQSLGNPSLHGSLPHQVEPQNLQKVYAGSQPIKPDPYSLATVNVITTATCSRHIYTNAMTTCGPSHTSIASNTTSATSTISSSNLYGQGPTKTVSAPTSAHSLIQQGLVPNPIYSPTSTSSISDNVNPTLASSRSPGIKGSGSQMGNTPPPPCTTSLHTTYPKPGIMSGTPIPRMSSSPSAISQSHHRQSTPPAAHYSTSASAASSCYSLGSPSGAMPHHKQGMPHHQNPEHIAAPARASSLHSSLPRDAVVTAPSHTQPVHVTGRNPLQASVVHNHFAHLPSNQQSEVLYASSPYHECTPLSKSSGVQMQPLNLQNPERPREGPTSPNSCSKRKALKDSSTRKRPKMQEGAHSSLSCQVSPVLARVSAPTPLVAGAATMITTVMNTIAFPNSVTSDVVSQMSSGSSTASVTVTTTSTVSTTANSVLGKQCPKGQSGFFDSYLTFVNSTAKKQDYPLYKNKGKQKSGKPAVEPKAQTQSPPLISSSVAAGVTASNLSAMSSNSNNSTGEPDKSVSPASSSGSVVLPVTKLKKAWLQRHSDEDSFKRDDVADSSFRQLSPSSVTGSKSSSSICSSPKPRERSPTHLPTINGHNADKPVLYDDSTSSASEPEGEHPNSKRAGRVGKAKAPSKDAKRQKKISGNSSDAPSNEDKQENQMKELEEIKDEQPVKQPKKRGRKPKPKPNKDEAAKKLKPCAPGEKPSIARLKRTGEPFLQDASCCEVAPKLSKCRECRMTTNQRNKKMTNIFCRFYAFRRLRYSKNGFLANAGFSEPTDAREDELKLWLPQVSNPPADLDLETSKFLLSHVGNQFCDLVEQEKEAQNMHLAEDKTIAWKCVVQGVREMCDVCETTLFNIHWACNKCGFVVCIDCYKARKSGSVKWAQNDDDSPGKDRDKYWWLLCNNRQPHEQDKLIITQIIANNALWEMGKMVHAVRKRWQIEMHCVCMRNNMDKDVKPRSTNGICKQLMSSVNQNFIEKQEPMNGLSDTGKPGRKSVSINGSLVAHINQEDPGNYNSSSAASPLCWLADVALNSSGKLDSDRLSVEMDNKPGKDESPSKQAEKNKEEHFSTLRELLIRPTTKTSSSSKPNKCNTGLRGPKKQLNTLDDVINCMIEQSVNNQDDPPCSREEKKLIHYMRRYPQPRSGWEPLPIRIFTLAESKLLYPNVLHSWLCEGRLLRLHDPTHSHNLCLFQEQWKRGQPVLVSSVNKALDMGLWHPEAFARDFGEIKNDLVNCHNGTIVPNQPMRRFWEGFENLSKRMKDETGQYMLLKLKDWPPGDDFSEMLPGRFQDLMKALPMPEYTHRNGKLNLAGRLPDCFVRPDLGPKMYNAYGSALYPTKGTTNLHLDISDAVNVMVYVGVPRDCDDERHVQEALRAIDEAGCDVLTRQRVREDGERPGALWHIFNARDADKIRDLLNKVATEKGEKLEAHHDPIHDQSWYLDSELRERLYCEYGVEGYAIAQCLGDAVFIPAGAPHQVRNLHSCIKVAEDFVSPENVSHCFTLTQEFRDLSDTHTNHEDKLQVKNIIYHAVKDALSVLLSVEAEEGKSGS